MSLPKADYQAYDEPIRVYDRNHKDQLLERLKELHPEQDPYCDCRITKPRPAVNQRRKLNASNP